MKDSKPTTPKYMRCQLSSKRVKCFYFFNHFPYNIIIKESQVLNYMGC